MRLGWLMEANWTDPILFFIYSVAKPIASALILVFMLEVIAGPTGRGLRSFVVVGSALWTFVINGIAGLGWSILDDRERYRMLKYLYLSPSDFLTVMLGRAAARIGVGAMGAVITLVVGVVALGVPFDWNRVDFPLLVAAMALGLLNVTAIGVAIAAICIQMRQEAWNYPDAFAGALFLVSGAVFPIAVLPNPVQVVALLNPLSWWMAGVREALFPAGPSSIGGAGSLYASLAGRMQPGAGEIVLALLVTGAVVTLTAVLAFRASERRAKDRGLLDETTGS
jgi:ABC-2 type transport system permease protein